MRGFCFRANGATEILTGRPREVASAEQVQVEMEDGLTAAWADVVDRAVPVFDVAFARELGGDHVRVTDNLEIIGGECVHADNVLLRNDEQVSWRLGVDVLKGEDEFIFVDFARGNVAGDDLAEETVRVGHVRQSMNRWKSYSGKPRYRRKQKPENSCSPVVYILRYGQA